MKLLPKGRFAVARTRPIGWTLVAVAAALLAGNQATQDAVANGDTRTISLHHTHTKETVTVTFRRNGQYDERALEQLNWILRDWRRDEATRMDPRLFDIVWAVHREVRSSEPIHVVSAYRSPQTNSMLRRRSSGVAENSQHTRGKAIDFFLPDVAIERVRAVGMRLQYGGVGYYPTSYNPFVHLDVGSVRAWPRMTRDQLVRLFPDGKTVHLPTDGRPLPGYEEARADVLARGGTVAGVSAYASADPVPGRGTERRGFWATLLGRDEDEDAQETRSAGSLRRGPQRIQMASAGGDESPTSALMAYNQASEAPRRAAPATAMPDPVAGVRTSPAIQVPPPAASAPAPSPVRTAALPAPETRQVFGAALPAGRPTRPEDVMATGTLAYAPMPPARPELASVHPRLSAPPPPDKRMAEAAAGISHPLPPARPPQAIQVASIGPVLRPPAPQAQAVPRVSTEQRDQLRALFAKSQMGTVAPALAPRRDVAPVRVEPKLPAGALASSSALATRFTKEPPSLRIDRFSGVAVEPLPGSR